MSYFRKAQNLPEAVKFAREQMWRANYEYQQYERDLIEGKAGSPMVPLMMLKTANEQTVQALEFLSQARRDR